MEASPALFAVRACLPQPRIHTERREKGKKNERKNKGGEQSPSPFPSFAWPGHRHGPPGPAALGGAPGHGEGGGGEEPRP